MREIGPICRVRGGFRWVVGVGNATAQASREKRKQVHKADPGVGSQNGLVVLYSILGVAVVRF